MSDDLELLVRDAYADLAGPPADAAMAGIRRGIRRRRTRHRIAAGAATTVAVGAVVAAAAVLPGTHHASPAGSAPTATQTQRTLPPWPAGKVTEAYVPGPRQIPVGWTPDGYTRDPRLSGRNYLRLADGTRGRLLRLTDTYLGREHYGAGLAQVAIEYQYAAIPYQWAPTPLAKAGFRPTTVAGHRAWIQRDQEETNLCVQLPDGRWVVISSMNTTGSEAIARHVAATLPALRH